MADLEFEFHAEKDREAGAHLLIPLGSRQKNLWWGLYLGQQLDRSLPKHGLGINTEGKEKRLRKLYILGLV